MHTLGCLAFSSLVIFATSGATARDLVERDIRDRIVGHSLRWTSSGGESEGSLYFDADGTAYLSMDGHFEEERGRWQIVDDRLCTRWNVARGGEEKCYFVRAETDLLYSTTGGNWFRVVDPGA